MEKGTATLPIPSTASLLFTEVLTEFQNDKRDKSFSRQENLRYGLHLEAYLHLHHIKLLEEITHHSLRGYKLYLKGTGLSAVSVNDYMTRRRRRASDRSCSQSGGGRGGHMRDGVLDIF